MTDFKNIVSQLKVAGIFDTKAKNLPKEPTVEEVEEIEPDEIEEVNLDEEPVLKPVTKLEMSTLKAESVSTSVLDLLNKIYIEVDNIKTMVSSLTRNVRSTPMQEQMNTQAFINEGQNAVRLHKGIAPVSSAVAKYLKFGNNEDHSMNAAFDALDREDGYRPANMHDAPLEPIRKEVYGGFKFPSVVTVDNALKYSPGAAAIQPQAILPPQPIERGPGVPPPIPRAAKSANFDIIEDML